MGAGPQHGHIQGLPCRQGERGIAAGGPQRQVLRNSPACSPLKVQGCINRCALGVQTPVLVSPSQAGTRPAAHAPPEPGVPTCTAHSWENAGEPGGSAWPAPPSWELSKGTGPDALHVARGAGHTFPAHLLTWESSPSPTGPSPLSSAQGSRGHSQRQRSKVCMQGRVGKRKHSVHLTLRTETHFPKV